MYRLFSNIYLFKQIQQDVHSTGCDLRVGLKTICHSCERFRWCFTPDKRRGMACTDYKKGEENVQINNYSEIHRKNEHNR